METYSAIKARHQKEVDNFPFLWAFGQKQFDEMLLKNNVTKKDILSIGAGGYIRKTDENAMDEMFTRQDKELKEAQKMKKFLKESFEHEMWNHEYYLSGNIDEIIIACGILPEDFRNDEEMQEVFAQVEKKYLRDFEKENLR